ncbi:PAS domain S-box protein [Proteobacteria bacterium 005FR1]|nr:PAS domain S-box protein [Proteobacteria bacterium 005FR1]
MSSASYRELEAVCRATDAALFLTDDQGRCLFINPAASKMTGYEPQELHHRPLYPLLRADDSSEPLAGPDEEVGQTYFLRKDGQAFEAIFNRHSVDSVYEVLELREVTAELRRERGLRLIAAVETELNRLAPPEQIIDAVGRALGDELGVNLCFFCDFQPDTDVLVVQHTWRRGKQPLSLMTFRASQFLTQDVLEASRRGEAFVVRDTERHSRVKAGPFAELNIRSFVAVPTDRGGEWRHLLVVCDERVREWPNDEISQLREVASRLFPGLERTRTEQALRESELKYRTLFETMNDGFAIVEMIYDDDHRPIDYRYLEVNPAFEKHTGFKEAAGKRVREFLPQISDEWVQTYADVVSSGEPVEFVAPARLMGRWFDISAYPFGDPKQGRLAVLFTDITERKRWEDQAAFLAGVTDDLALSTDEEEIIRAVGSRLGSFLGVSGYFIADVDESQTGATIAHSWTANEKEDIRGEYRLSDYVSESFVESARNAEILVVHDAETDPRTSEKDCSAKGMRAFVTLPIVRSGRWRYLFTVYDERARQWPEDDIRLLREVASRLFPRVERARVEAALRESESRYRALFNSIGQGFAVLEVIYAADGSPVDILLVETNPAFERHSGLENVAGRKLYEIQPTVSPDWLQVMAQVARTGKAERRIQYSDALHRWLEVDVFRVEGGHPHRVATLVSDISDRIRGEQALRAGDQRKDEFLAMLAHELRNPLAAIYNVARLLDTELLHRSAHSFVEILERQAGTLGRMVDDLLDVSRITRGLIQLHPSTTDLVTVAQRAATGMKAQMDDKHHQLRLDLPSEPVMVLGDEVRLEQILVNLLTNAAKYTDPGGHIALGMITGNDEVHIKVTDTGIGMSPDVLDRIFELFGQAERGLARSEGGLGIGLTIVKRLVELHGGQIEAHSEGPGAGAEFNIVLPLAPGGTVVAPAIPAKRAVAAAEKRILLVEDQQDIAETLALLLESSGHDVSIANDGEMAIAKAAELLPEVVLLDIGLPGIDGYEVAAQIRAHPLTRNTVLAALTGYGQDRDREMARGAGFDAHFVKPVDMAALNAFLDGLGNGSRP